MRRILLMAAAVLTVGAVAALPALAATRTVKGCDNFFIKKGGGTITGQKGTVLRWIWTGEKPHSVTGQGAGRFINSGNPKAKGSYRRTMTRRGTFRIICIVHEGQTMRVKVT